MFNSLKQQLHRQFSRVLTGVMLICGCMSVSLQAAEAQQTGQQKVLMVVTSHGQMGNTGKPTGFWLAELTHPYFALADAGYTVDIVSIAGGKPPVDPGSIDKTDADNRRFLDDQQLMAQLENTPKLADVDAADYAAVVFSGGHGTMWDFPDSDAVKNTAAHIYQLGGVVAAVCHGPAALVNVKLNNGTYLLEGKRVTGFSNVEEAQIELTEVMPFLLEDAMKQRGAEFSAAAPWQESVVVDGRLVTGQNPQSAHGLGKAVAELLKSAMVQKQAETESEVSIGLY